MMKLDGKIVLQSMAVSICLLSALPSAHAAESMTNHMPTDHRQTKKNAEFLLPVNHLPAEQRLSEAYRLEKAGNAAPAITELQSLLDSKTLNPAGIGKAWDILGLAFEDQGDFSESRRAFERSIQAYESMQNDASDYAMVLDDFAELNVAAGQLEPAVRLMKKALHLYEKENDHAGVTRSSSDLAGAFLTQKKIREGRKSLDRALKESRLTNELDDDDFATLASLQGWLAQCDGDLPSSVSKYQQALDLLRKYYGEEHVSTAWGYVLLGQVRAEAGNFGRSIIEINNGLAILGRKLHRQDPRFLVAQIAYSHVLEKVGRGPEAKSLQADAERQLNAFRNSQCANCTVSAKAF